MKFLAVLLCLFVVSTSANAQVSGTVFKDFNGDGTKQANEPLVSGITVKIGRASCRERV